MALGQRLVTARVARQETLIMCLSLQNQLFSQGKLLYPKTLLHYDLSARQTCSLGHPKERREEEVRQPCAPTAANKVSRLFPKSGDRRSSQSPHQVGLGRPPPYSGKGPLPLFYAWMGQRCLRRGAYPVSPG